MSFRFVSFQSKTFDAVGMSSLIFWFQERELWFSVYSNAVQNFNRSLNKRRMFPSQTIATEGTAEKCLDKRNAKQTSAQVPARQRNKQILNPQISRAFRLIQFVYIVRNISNRTCNTASKFEKIKNKNWPSHSSRSLDHDTECDYLTLFCDFLEPTAKKSTKNFYALFHWKPLYSLQLHRAPIQAVCLFMFEI